MSGTNGPIPPSSGTVHPAARPKGYDGDSTIELRPIWCQMHCPAHRYMLGILSSTAVPFKKGPCAAKQALRSRSAGLQVQCPFSHKKKQTTQKAKLIFFCRFCASVWLETGVTTRGITLTAPQSLRCGTRISSRLRHGSASRVVRHPRNWDRCTQKPSRC